MVGWRRGQELSPAEEARCGFAVPGGEDGCHGAGRERRDTRDMCAVHSNSARWGQREDEGGRWRLLKWTSEYQTVAPDCFCLVRSRKSCGYPDVWWYVTQSEPSWGGSLIIIVTDQKLRYQLGNDFWGKTQR